MVADNMFRAAYFVTVGAAAYVVIHRYILALPAYASNPVLAIPACYTQTGVTYYDILGERLNALLCPINSSFSAVNGAPNARPLLDLFGPVFVMATMILVYESFRPSARGSLLARSASLSLLVGQVITAAVSTPFYLAGVAISTRASRGKDRPKAEYAWTALIAVIGGLGVPTAYVGATNNSYLAMTVWQAFPLYILALALVVPPLLRPLVRGASAAPAVMVMAALGILASVKAQYGVLFTSDVPLRAAFLLDPWPATRSSLTFAAHLMFLADFVLVYLAIGSAVIMAYKPASLGAAVSYTAALVVGTLAIGPGGAIAALWAYRELTA